MRRHSRRFFRQFHTVKDVIIDDWLATQKAFDKQDPKMVYYMSMEFLMGRALGNNMINLKMYKEVKEALEEIGLNLDEIEDQEPDPALGNGGLGRLAASLYGVTGNTWIRSLRLRYPLPLRNVQTEDQRRFSGGSAG